MPRVVVITGATSGIGRQAALAFASAGEVVVGTGRDQARLSELAPHVDLALTLDHCDPQSVRAATAAILGRYGRVDVLVLNAGQGHFVAALEDSVKDMQRVMDANLWGPVRVTQALLPSMKERGGVILAISSVAGLRGYPRHGAYCASKHALNGWFGALRTELLGSGVQVGILCPPAVDTPFFENAGYDDFKADHPGLKLMSPQEVAQHIVDASEHPPALAVLGTRAKVLEGVNRVAPGVLEWARRKSGKIGGAQ
ncbi:MAG: SDR family NAD(P)-dependent oxidoreductase [Myxococcota bacterium]|nr:SDR family NAD(P)-dependent oxidoreductase [Myxococcota bacterium]